MAVHVGQSKENRDNAEAFWISMGAKWQGTLQRKPVIAIYYFSGKKKRTATFGYTFLSYISSLTKICCSTWMVWVSCGTITLQIKIALDKLVSMKELLKSTIFPLLSQSITSKRVRKLRCWFISHVNKFMLTYVSLSLCCW